MVDPDSRAEHEPDTESPQSAAPGFDGEVGSDAAPVAGVPLGGRTPAGDAQTRSTTAERTTIPLLSALREDDVVSELIDAADEFMAAQGFTEHGQRHANLVGRIAFNVMTHLGHEERTAELAAAAGYLHDIGNVITRSFHGQTGALLAWERLRGLEVPVGDVAHVMAAVGNHEEQHGEAVSPIAAAVILADKSDVHRSRVRPAALIAEDIHDRVNYAVESSFLRVDPQARTLTLELLIDTSVSQVLEYFEIFLERMIMCRRAAQVLGCDFRITVNDTPVL